VLVVAPHPDDETLGSGARWHELVHEGHDVHVVVVTMGDDFRVDAEAVFQTLRPNAHTYRALGELRARESEAACRLLGLPSGHLHFLGLPDGGTAELFLRYWDEDYHDERTATERDPYLNTAFPGIRYQGLKELWALRELLKVVRPATVILPHPYDHHPDHWASHAFAVLALESLRQEGYGFAQHVVQLQYLVHFPGWPTPMGLDPHAPLLPPAALADAPTAWYPWPLPQPLVELKRAALLQYKTQMQVMAPRLLSFVRRDELFGVSAPAFVSPWHGRWGEVPYTLATAAPVGLAALLQGTTPDERLQVAADAHRLMVHVTSLEGVAAEDRVDLHLALIHPSFPEGVRRLVATLVGRELRAEVLGGEHLSGGKAEVLADRSAVAILPRSWLGEATTFLLGARLHRPNLLPERIPFRLMHMRAQV
jgi:LmbE family N-acetylglucosaminyl deacetylase